MLSLTEIWRRLRDPRTLAEFARFCATGLTNSVVDFGLYIFLTRTFAFWAGHIVAASAIAYAAAICVSFMLNNFWTFRRDGRGWARRSIKFLIVSYTALGIHVVVFWFLTELGMNDLLAKVAATAVGGVWNFLMYKFWAFAVREPVKPPVA
jgi:putative flippase GtrA